MAISMNLIDELMAEVADATMLNNGEIIVRACERIGVTCTKCNYPPNARTFDALLNQYVYHKVYAHYYHKKVKYWTEAERKAQLSFSKRVLEGYYLQEGARQLLIPIWPCEDCTKLFNPTGRVKLGPKIHPHKQGVLNYV